MFENSEHEAASGAARGEAHIVGCVDIDATPLLAFIRHAWAQTGVVVTIDHIVGRAAACAIERHPTTNGHADADRVVAHETIDLLFVAQSNGGRTFNGVRLEHAAEKTTVEIARELAVRTSDRLPSHSNSGEPRNGTQKPLFGAARKVAKLLDRSPTPAAPDMVASALVTSVGMFGSPYANAALSTFFRVPTIIETRNIVKRAVVVDDQVVVRPMLRLSATVDRRVIDGFEADLIMADLCAYCESPWDFELDVDRPDRTFSGSFQAQFAGAQQPSI